MNILLVADESAGGMALAQIAKTDHTVVAVLTSKPGHVGKGAVWRMAEKLDIPTWPANLVRKPEFAETIRAHDVDVLLNIHSMYIISEAVLEAPRLGSFNLHPGPLPAYAGLNPVSWALYEDARHHGVTVHRMVKEIDAGSICYQAMFPINDEDNALSVLWNCVRDGVPLIMQLLEVANHSPSDIPCIIQDKSLFRYNGPEVPCDGCLDWTVSARQIFNFVRACDFGSFPSPWRHPRTSLLGQEVQIQRACLTGKPCSVAPGTISITEGPTAWVSTLDEWIQIDQFEFNAESGNCFDQRWDGQQFNLEISKSR